MHQRRARAPPAPPCSDLCKRAGSRRDWGYNCVTVIVGLRGLCSRADGPSPFASESGDAGRREGITGRGIIGKSSQHQIHPGGGGSAGQGPRSRREHRKLHQLFARSGVRTGLWCSARPWPCVSSLVRRESSNQQERGRSWNVPLGGGVGVGWGLFTGSSPRLSLVSWMIVWRKSRLADKCPAQD